MYIKKYIYIYIYLYIYIQNIYIYMLKVRPVSVTTEGRVQFSGISVGLVRLVQRSMILSVCSFSAAIQRRSHGEQNTMTNPLPI